MSRIAPSDRAGEGVLMVSKAKRKTPTGNYLPVGEMAPQVGLEPTTLRLTAECSAIELLRNMDGVETCSFYPYGIRRRPTLPGRFQPSTIGAKRLNFCVRDGNRWDPLAIITGKWNQMLAAPSKPHRKMRSEFIPASDPNSEGDWGRVPGEVQRTLTGG